MHLLPYSLALSCLLSLASESLAIPAPLTPSSPLSIPLVRRRPQPSSTVNRLKSHKDAVVAKYGLGTRQQKRGSGLNLLSNQEGDVSFYGSIAVGTPAVAFNVILDTGSSDLWLASSNSSAATSQGIPTFNPNESSTFKNLGTTFQIQYGSGAAEGFLGTDVVNMAGLSIKTQTFAVATATTENLLSQPVSGLMGLAFESISSSRAPPLWQGLATSGALDQPLMAFQLTRFTNDSGAQELEPGGTFNLGAVNTSLFTGDIDYQPIPGGQGTYWIQELTGLTVNGNAVTIPAGTGSYAAIDTGTTLVIGPQDAIAGLYAQIPGSEALTGEDAGYYTYPCDSAVNVTLRFGASTVSWPVSSADFNFQRKPNTNICVGAFIAVDTTSGSGVPAWIVGDTFLKNVYSVYNGASPPSVGFAKLSDAALAMNGKDAPAPNPTIGLLPSAAAQTGGLRDKSNGALSVSRAEFAGRWMAVGAAVVAGGLVL